MTTEETAIDHTKPLRIAFLFYDGMTALDAIGPHEVLSRLPDTDIYRVAEKKGLIKTGYADLQLYADHTLQDVQAADVLLIPGGAKAPSLRNHPEILEWIRHIHQHTLWTTSVCTGSLILGAAGLLQGVPATSHWSVMNRLAHWGALPTKKRVVTAGKIMTAAGVSAGIDMGLLLAEKLRGTFVAETIQLVIEYDPEPPFDAGSPEKAPFTVLKNLQEKLHTKFADE